MGDRDDRQPVGVDQRSHEGEDLAPDRRVERCDRLVGQQQRRLHHHRARDHDALALPTRHLVRVERHEALGWAQAGAGERIGHLRGLTVAFAPDPQTLGDDLVDRLARVERAGRVLEDHLDVTPSAAAAGAGVGAGEADRPVAERLQTLDRADQRGLARTRLAHQRQHLARTHLERHAVDRASGAEAHVRVVHRDERGSLTGCLPRGRTPHAGRARRRAARAPRHGRPRPRPGSAGGTRSLPAGGPGRAGRPPDPVGCMRDAGSPIVGNAAASARVYGWCGDENSSWAGPSSTTRPAYITARWSHTSDSTDRSWVMKIIDRPRSRRSCASSASTWACTITSSAVVGSSAISRSGSQASAIAISTRWRWPPDSWCG